MGYRRHFDNPFGKRNPTINELIVYLQSLPDYWKDQPLRFLGPVPLMFEGFDIEAYCYAIEDDHFGYVETIPALYFHDPSYRNYEEDDYDVFREQASKFCELEHRNQSVIKELNSYGYKVTSTIIDNSPFLTFMRDPEHYIIFSPDDYLFVKQNYGLQIPVIGANTSEELIKKIKSCPNAYDMFGSDVGYISVIEKGKYGSYYVKCPGPPNSGNKNFKYIAVIKPKCILDYQQKLQSQQLIGENRCEVI